MKIISIILMVAGIIGLVFFGIQAFNDSESFNFLGLDIAVSKANWTPVIISAALLVAGVVLNMAKKK